jgi:hypothetical protein
MAHDLTETIQPILVLLSMFVWFVYIFVKLMPLNTMLRLAGELDRKQLKKLLFYVWLVGILAGVGIGLAWGDYYGSTYILMQRLLGWGIVAPSVTIVAILPPILRYEQEYKHKQQKTLSDNPNKERE